VTPVDSLPEMDASLRERYVFERELGHGGMATVYLARDTRHDRPVAVKVLSPALAASLGIERFLFEIRVMARLQHAHILPLLDSGLLEPAQQRSPFYVMPYVEGESLRERLKREGQLPITDALKIAGDVAGALAYAHSHGVVHRDIKPENILISNNQAIVADFGIARAASLASSERLTEAGLVMGTPHYMSPEQAAGNPSLDGRTDIYALGCVLYEMLAGQPPFTGPTAQAVLARSLAETPPAIRPARPTVSDEIDRIIARMLAKVPADRFGTAAELGEALSRASTVPAIPATPPSSGARPWRAGLTVAVLILLAASAMLLRRHGSTPRIIESASSIAVLPFTPSGPDTALSRLGRDLVFTLSAELDGLGGIRVVDPHTVLAHTKTDELGATPAQARALGAGSVVQGSLVRVGGGVRLDMSLIGSDSAAAPLARATVTASPDSVAVLTDSAARALLVQIWSRGTPPTPSLDVALRTRSVTALRAFLQGEGDITQGQWEAAAEAYQRAMDADSAFWIASARYVYSRYWSLSEPAESVVTRLDRHLAELPERERLNTQAILLQSRDSIKRAIEVARAAGERYSDSWFGWLFYGDAGLHNGPIVGHSLSEARTGFERAVALNANLIPVWEHLMLVALLDGDTALGARSFGNLTRLNAGPSLGADGYGNRMLQFRFLNAIARGDSAGDRLVDSLARDPAPAAVGDGSFYDPYRYGYFAEQIRVSRSALASDVSPERKRVHQRLLALSWGGRGALDSTLAMLDRTAAEGTDSSAALRSYGLAAIGVWLDALNPDEAAKRRQAAAQTAGADTTVRAEMAWVDGVLAAGRRDRRALAVARVGLRQSGDPTSGALDRSLGAMDAALRGATREAGEQMAALEWQEAAVSDPDYRDHPLVLALDRLASARWLLASGNPEEALRLLGWVDAAFYLHPSTIYNRMFVGLADLERGRVEERLGHTGIAAGYYRRFLRRYDRPVQRHTPLVNEAKARLREVGS
jgi:serine/threonine protein kinase/tetratricopeptide (TPR) repeat protein